MSPPRHPYGLCRPAYFTTSIIRPSETSSGVTVDGVPYRYIVPRSKEVQDNLDAFMRLFSATTLDKEREFLLLPNTEFSHFVAEVVIHDPGAKTMRAFGYPPSTRTNCEDVLDFDHEISLEFAAHFVRIWNQHRQQMPITGLNV